MKGRRSGLNISIYSTLKAYTHFKNNMYTSNQYVHKTWTEHLPCKKLCDVWVNQHT